MKIIKVLQVIPALTAGGISSVVINWYRNIDRTKYQFDFITFNDGPLREEIESLGGKIYLIKTFKQSPRSHVNAVNNIFRVEKTYDAIHVHNSFKNVVMLKLAQRAGITIRVCHSHTSGLEKKSLAPVFSLLRYFTHKYSNVHLACGQEAGEFLFKNRPFQILNNAIDVSRMLSGFIPVDDVHEKYNIPKNKILITLVARFSDVKNHQFLVKIAQSTLLNTNIHFVCIGDGPLKISLQNNIDAHNVNSRFTLLGATQEIPSLLNISDGFIMPSLFEGVSVALLEAQASSLQCLISDTISPEVNMNLGNITFLSLKQTDHWINALNQLVKPILSEGEINTAFDTQGYSINSVISKLQLIYQR